MKTRNRVFARTIARAMDFVEKCPWPIANVWIQAQPTYLRPARVAKPDVAVCEVVASGHFAALFAASTDAIQATLECSEHHHPGEPDKWRYNLRVAPGVWVTHVSFPPPRMLLGVLWPPRPVAT